MSYPHKQSRILRARRPGRNSQQGVVIVVALFIVAMVATMAYVMMSRLARDTYRTQLIVRDVQAERYAEGSILWAKDQLRNDWIRQKKDKRVDETPIKSPVNEVNGYTIISTIYDTQGRFNINNVSNPDWQTDFIRLIQLVYPKMSADNAAAVVRAALDWVMPGVRDNEFQQYYTELPVPYRPGHRFMVDPGELRLVKGVTPELYEALKPYITALPTITPINPVSAEPPVLALLGQNMPLDAATSLKQLLAKAPPPNKEVFMAMDFVKNHPVQDSHITLVSQYFLVETEVRIERQRILLYTLMQRNGSNGKADVTILWQHRGTE